MDSSLVGGSHSLKLRLVLRTWAGHLKREHLEEFVTCYNANNRFERKKSERFKAFKYDELIKRDKLNLDIFWLKDETLEDGADLPAPEVIAREIAGDLRAALEQFEALTGDSKSEQGRSSDTSG